MEHTMKLYLNGGGNVAKGEAKHIDKLTVMSSKHKKVTILLLSKKEKQKIEQYKMFSPAYFKKLGAKKIDLILPNSSKKEIVEKNKESGPSLLARRRH